MKGLLLLFTFMTRLPVPTKLEFDSKELGKSMKFFPIVGIVIGIILYAIYMVGYLYIESPLVLAIVVVLAEVILTGGLHLDGLADTFDSIFSYRSKQKMLDIMKDSRLGTNGALALIMYFMLKVGILAAIIGSNKSFYFYFNGMLNYAGAVILITPVLSRINPVLNCAVSPYAKASGSAKDFVENTTKNGVLIATIIGLVFAGIVGILSGKIIDPLHLVNIIAITMALGLYFSKLIDKKIGGLTGDTLGALLELSSVIILFGLYVS